MDRSLISHLEGMCVRGGLDFIFKFFDRMMLDSILKVARLSRSFHVITVVYLSQRFDVDKLLQHWVESGPALRRCLLETGAIVVGSTPLRFLQRSSVFTGFHTLDLCADLRGAFRLGMFFLARGYVYIASRYGPRSFYGALHYTPMAARLKSACDRSPAGRASPGPVLQTFNFKRLPSAGSSYSRLSIIVVRIAPIRHVINFGESESSLRLI